MSAMLRLPLALVALIALNGCAEFRLLTAGGKSGSGARIEAPDRGNYKIGEPYQIKGVWYRPAEDYGYDETGIASWYGPDFHNKTTANGEIYDMNDLTAAHRTLPMPSFVRVTNLENGRQLVLRINDRGPYAHGRIIDISRRGAQLLGFDSQGTARVRVQILADESRQIAQLMRDKNRAEASRGPARTGSTALRPGETAPVAAPTVSVAAAPLDAPPPRAGGALAPMADPTGRTGQVAVRPTGMFIQAGAFSSKANAERQRQRLTRFGPAQLTAVQSGSQTLWRVRMGPIATVADGDRVLEKIISAGMPEARLVVE